MNKDDLKLVYILKIGYNSKQEGLYEFIFVKDTSIIDTKELGWEETPASANANPPDESQVDMILSLKSNKIDFKCLHELDDRPYSDGYYTIHCLAYEDIASNNSDVLYDETTLLVFHFGMKASEVKDLFLSRDILLKEVEITKSESFNQPIDEEDEEPEYEED